VIDQYKVLEDFQTTADWTVMNADVTTLAANTSNFVYGSQSMSCAKTNGDANSTDGGMYKTVAYDLRDYDLRPWDYITWCVYASDLTDVAYSFVRLGSSASNYLEWRYDDSVMLAGWSFAYSKVHDAYIGGTGGSLVGPTWLAVGVSFDAQDKALAGILFDELTIVRSDVWA